MRLRYLSIVLALLTSACGFHLRGLGDVPKWLTNVSIISQDGDKELASKLRAQLEGYKISVNPEPLHATYWLVINKSNVQQQIISVGSTTKPRQYQLIMRTEFTLQTPKGQIIKAPRTVFVSRQFTANNDRILGSDYEERVLISEMRHDVVIQILNRLSRE